MRADRLISVMLLLQSRGKMKADELADELGVSVRTVYRDIDALSIAGIPVYTQSGIGGGCYLDDRYRISLTGLTRPQIRALFASGSAGPFADLGLDQAVEDTLLKLLAALPPVHRQEAERMHARVHFDPSGWYYMQHAVPNLDRLHEAVWEDRKIGVHYRRSDANEIDTILSPYGLVAKASIWYLVAAKPDGNLRTYRVSRFVSIALLDETFQRQPDFNLKAYWESTLTSFQTQWSTLTVRLRLNRKHVAVLEQAFPDRYEIVEPIDDVWLRVEIAFSNIEEARAFVLSMREAVIVESPQELHDSVIEWAQAILRFHGYD